MKKWIRKTSLKQTLYPNKKGYNIQPYKKIKKKKIGGTSDKCHKIFKGVGAKQKYRICVHTYMSLFVCLNKRVLLFYLSIYNPSSIIILCFTRHVFIYDENKWKSISMKNNNFFFNLTRVLCCWLENFWIQLRIHQISLCCIVIYREKFDET